MTNADLLKGEIELIKDNKLKDVVKTTLNYCPDCLQDIPASSSGKYHPEYSLGIGGLVRHIKAAIGIARSLIETENLLTFLKADRELFTKVHRLGFDFFKDCVYASLILHDCCKQGLDGKGHTIFEHPLVAVDLFEQCVDELGYDDKEKTKYISSAIGEHMGQWTKSKYSNIELHKPSNGVSYCVHLCDYLASRKFLEFNFDKYEL